MPPLRLVFPHIVGLVLMVIVWVSSPEKLYVYIPLLHETIELSTPLEYSIVIKIILTVIILTVVLLIQLLRDYGQFIPKSWDMRVFFDEEKLGSVVKSFSAEERKKLRIPKEWRTYRDDYMNHLNQLLKEYEAPDFAKFGPTTFGIGQFRYEYHKIPGRQRYELYDGRGTVRFQFDSREESTSVLVEFNQIRREADCVEPSVVDIFYRFNTVVAPTFSQWVPLGKPRKPIRLSAITCPTRIRFFPSLEVGRTLYLIDIRELGSLPISC